MTEILVDTNVLVAAHVQEHEHHSLSFALWEHLPADRVCISTHVFAEFFASTTRLPRGMRLSPEHALSCLQAALTDVHIVALEERDYQRALARTAASGGLGSRIYDALHLEAALKAGAHTIYTWNLEYFLPLEKDTGIRILTPAQAS